MSTSLFLNLESGTVLLTANARQAEQTRLAYAQWKRSQNVEAWASPAIYSWDEWLKNTGENLLWSGYSGKEGVRSLLTPLQEQMVWEQVIRAEIDQPLLHLPSTAALARQAWGLLQSWRLPDPSTELFQSEDVQAFSSWVKNYFSRCRSAAWLDQARLPDTLKRAINKGIVDLPHRIILSGFLQLTPQQHEMVKAIQNQGSQVNLYKAQQYNASLTAYSYQNPREEMHAIANWCREKIEANPNSRIAVVLPKLSTQRDELDYVFRKTLFPNSFSTPDEFLNGAYQFSSGLTLKQSQVAKTAIILLELMDGVFTIDQISYLLRSPYCYGGRAEHTQRVHIDRWLRSKNYLRFDLNSLLEALKVYRSDKRGRSEATLFEVSLQTLRTTMGLAKQYFSPSIWAKQFLSYIEKFGWPDVHLSLSEQRQAQAMRSCLTEFASIDFVQNEMDFKTALSSLKRIYRNKTLKITQVYAPIQILDLNEIYSVNYDFLWLGQLSDQVLPQGTNANPLLPYQWQRKRKIMNTTPELRLQEAEQRTQYLKSSAPEVIVSYAQTGNEERDQSPGMFRELEFVEQSNKLRKINSDVQIELVEETNAQPYQGLPKVSTSVFKHQSECPFKSFALKRLVPDTIKIGHHGLNALQRGSLMHSALEFVWLRIGASDTLEVALKSEHLEIQVWEIIDQVISVFVKKNNIDLSERLRSIEQARLVRMCMAWLRLEVERATFELHRTEQVEVVKIGKLEVECRIDRIDEVSNIGFAIVDYKSGSQSPSAWFGERPDEPQMPIYALIENMDIVGLVYANMNAKEMGFKGISKENGIFPEIKSFNELSAKKRNNLEWNNLKDYWRENLENLADEFLSGYAVPLPKKGSQTCRHCDLQALCRINESVNVRHLEKDTNYV